MIEAYYLILNPIMALLVYWDARRRQVGGKVGGYSTTLWVILALVLGVFGFIA